MSEPREFYGALSELKVIKYFKEKYGDIEINDGGGADLKISVNGSEVYVEIKSFNDDYREVDEVNRAYVERVLRRAESAKRSCIIELSIEKNFMDVEGQVILDSLGDMLNSVQGEFEHRSFSGYDILLRPLKEWDSVIDNGVLEEVFEGNERYEYASISMESLGDNYKNVVVSRISGRKAADFIQYVKKKLNGKAISQIPKSGPGIVYFEMPMDFYGRVREVERIGLLELTKYLNKKTKRVNAVVIVADSISETDEHGLYHCARSLVIPNFSPRKEFPVNFSLLECRKPIEGIRVARGMKLSFSCIIPPLNRRKELVYCSRDGHEQLEFEIYEGCRWRLKILGKRFMAIAEGMFSVEKSGKECKLEFQLNGSDMLFLVDDELWAKTKIEYIDPQ